MNFVVTILLIGLVSARELLRAHYGPGVRQPNWIRWLNFVILLVLTAFFAVIGWQIISIIAESGF